LANQPPQPAAIAAAPVLQQGNAVQAQHMLGLPMENLAGVSVDEILNNKPALTMVMHYYKQLADENAALKNDLNTASTYVTGYDKKANDTSIAAWLQFLSSLCVGLGSNLLTSDNDKAKVPGLVLLAVGISLQGVGLYFAFRKR
jgi:hypothetical protein